MACSQRRHPGHVSCPRSPMLSFKRKMADRHLALVLFVLACGTSCRVSSTLESTPSSPSLSRRLPRRRRSTLAECLRYGAGWKRRSRTCRWRSDVPCRRSVLLKMFCNAIQPLRQLHLHFRRLHHQPSKPQSELSTSLSTQRTPFIRLVILLPLAHLELARPKAHRQQLVERHGLGATLLVLRRAGRGVVALDVRVRDDHDRSLARDPPTRGREKRQPSEGASSDETMAGRTLGPQNSRMNCLQIPQGDVTGELTSLEEQRWVSRAGRHEPE